MIRYSVLPAEIAGRRGYTVKIQDVAPEPFRSDLLAALACIASGVLVVILLAVARWLWA